MRITRHVWLRARYLFRTYNVLVFWLRALLDPYAIEEERVRAREEILHAQYWAHRFLIEF